MVNESIRSLVLRSLAFHSLAFHSLAFRFLAFRLLAPRSLASLGLALSALALSGALSGTPAIDEQPASSSPVFVELFTSQGCSSCPAADRLLSALAASDDDIVTLAFHVDYWNYIGWTDPFSSETWSDRQRSYARAFGDGRIYTPQLVVNGRRHGVGSSQSEVASMIRQATADETAGRIDLEITDSSHDRISVRVDTHLTRQSRNEELVVWVALAEDGLETSVGRGENVRRTLRNDRVVRRLERAGTITRNASHDTALIDIALKTDWQRDKLTVAAFVQETDSRHVVAAAAVPIL